jgi:hypothetical protein
LREVWPTTRVLPADEFLDQSGTEFEAMAIGNARQESGWLRHRQTTVGGRKEPRFKIGKTDHSDQNALVCFCLPLSSGFAPQLIPDGISLPEISHHHVRQFQIDIQAIHPT